MRRLVISDLHFGDRNGCDLLRYPWAQERLWPLLEGIDQLVLLGDTWELVFQRMEEAITASRPFFTELNRRFPGLEILKIPGNHDHHLVAWASDERREQISLGVADDHPFRVAPAERILRHLCPDLKIRSAYPMAVEDDICFIHGHYLASHLRSFGSRMFDMMGWRIWGQARRESDLTALDYEALMSPLYELTYQIAQLPEGLRSQVAMEQQAMRIAKLVGLPGQIGGQLARFASTIQARARRQPPPLLSAEPAPSEHLQAMVQVALNLKLDLGCRHVVFGHTHQPLLEVRLESQPQLAFHNCGSWFYDYREAQRSDYRERFWPGTALEIGPEGFHLHRLLEDHTHDLLLGQGLIWPLAKP